MKKRLFRYFRVALSIAGSAILLFSCKERKHDAEETSAETLMTEYSENLSLIMSRNGRRSYYFTTPLLEGYKLAREPYREFRKGVKITTYQDDSLSSVDSKLTANYAIYYENRKLWEAKGNVVVEKSDGKTLYTQQLFWNAQTGRIYSNVDSKVVQSGGREAFVGEGFESDEAFKDWRFRRMKGRMEFEMNPAADSVASPSASEPPLSPADTSATGSAAAARRRAGDGGSVAARPAPASPEVSGEEVRRPVRNGASAPSTVADGAGDSGGLSRPAAPRRGGSASEQGFGSVAPVPVERQSEPLRFDAAAEGPSAPVQQDGSGAARRSE